MIKSVRLDERLIHGQVATKWSRVLGVNRIVVANDEAAGNSVMQKSLMMAAPSTCKVAIVPVSKAVSFCNDPRAERLDILVIVSNPDDLLAIARQVKGIELVNVGNYGRIAQRRVTEQRKRHSNNLFTYPDEEATLREVIATGIPCNVQTIPDEAPLDLARVLGC